MANHVSAIKRNRQRLIRAARNKDVRSALRTALKKARVAISEGNLEAAQQDVQSASKALARAARKGVIHDRAASRTTSRIQSALSKLSTTA